MIPVNVQGVSGRSWWTGAKFPERYLRATVNYMMRVTLGLSCIRMQMTLSSLFLLCIEHNSNISSPTLTARKWKDGWEAKLWSWRSACCGINMTSELARTSPRHVMLDFI